MFLDKSLGVYYPQRNNSYNCVYSEQILVYQAKIYLKRTLSG
jgi:hypothetical protein